MIARELTEFFATFAPDGAAASFGADDPTFLSNVNAAYRRACWEEIRFDDVAYSEDQAFGRALAAHPRWRKAYHPRAAVLHAHDYPPLEFMRRYFDEYRGLRETIGHVEPIGVRSTVRDVRALVAADRRYMREQGVVARDALRWTGALGRAPQRPQGRSRRSARAPTAAARRVQRALSLERRAAEAHGAPPAPTLPPLAHRRGHAEPPRLRGRRARAARRPGAAARAVPGHGRARAAAHRVRDPDVQHRLRRPQHHLPARAAARADGPHLLDLGPRPRSATARTSWPAVLRAARSSTSRPSRRPVFREFERLVRRRRRRRHRLADRLPGARRSRACGPAPTWSTTTSRSSSRRRSSRLGRRATYRSASTASPAARGCAISTSTATAARRATFQYGVDHDVYLPRPIERRRDTVVAYAARGHAAARGRRSAILALEELHRRRPDVRIVLFGDRDAAPTPFAYEHVGVASHEELSWLFSEATVGLCLSLTNYSLMPQEMLACGLPCVDLDRPSTRSVFGADGPVELAPFDADALADALERCSTTTREWERRSRPGLEFVRDAHVGRRRRAGRARAAQRAPRSARSRPRGAPSAASTTRQ